MDRNFRGREFNDRMFDSKNLETAIVNIVDRCGRKIREVTLFNARNLVESGRYYLVTISDISFL